MKADQHSAVLGVGINHLAGAFSCTGRGGKLLKLLFSRIIRLNCLILLDTNAILPTIPRLKFIHTVRSVVIWLRQDGTNWTVVNMSAWSMPRVNCKAIASVPFAERRIYVRRWKARRR